MTLQDITRFFVAPSTAADLQPDRGDVIAFQTAGVTVFDATVTDVDWFCDEWNYKVEFRFQGRDGKWHTMTQWVAVGQVLS